MRAEWNLLTINLLADLNDREDGWTISKNDAEGASTTFTSPEGIPVTLSLADVEAFAYAHVLQRVEVLRVARDRAS